MNHFKSIEEATEYYESLGFKKYINNYNKVGIVANYQKCIKDKIGKKYFIDIDLWDFRELEHKFGYSYMGEYSCQLYSINNHNAFDLTYIDWEYEQVVDFIEQMFSNNMLDYYERWED